MATKVGTLAKIKVSKSSKPDLSSIFAQAIATSAQQRAQLNSMGTAGPLSVPSRKDIALSVMTHSTDIGEGYNPRTGGALFGPEAGFSGGGGAGRSTNPWETIAKGTSGYWALKGLGKVAETSPAQKVIDVLSRGQYTSANAVRALSRGENPFSAALSGTTGTVKGEYGQLIREQEKANKTYDPSKEWQYSLGGFLGDVFLDPTTYIGTGIAAKALKFAAKGAKAIPGAGKVIRPVVANSAKLEAVRTAAAEAKGIPAGAKLEDRVVPAVQRSISELHNTGTTTVNSSIVDQINAKLNKITPATEAVSREPIPGSTATPAGEATTQAAADIVAKTPPVETPKVPAPAAEVAQEAVAGTSTIPTAAAVSATAKGAEVSKILAGMRGFKRGASSFARRIAGGEIPLPLQETTDPVATALYKRRLSAHKMNLTKRERAAIAYQEAVKTGGRKTIEAVPREQADEISRALAVEGRTEGRSGQYINGRLQAGHTHAQIAADLEAQATQEGKKLSIPMWVKNRHGKWAVGMHVNADAFANLLHTGKVAKPIPLTAKGELRQAKEVVEIHNAEGKVVGRQEQVIPNKYTGELWYDTPKGRKPALEATHEHSAFLADSETLAEDLQKMHLLDPETRNLISLGDFLKKHGIEPATLQTSAAEQIVEKLSRGKGARKANPFYGQKPAKPKAGKELVEPTAPERTWTPFDKEALKEWRATHAPETLSPKGEANVLHKILNGTDELGKGKTPEEIVARAEHFANELDDAGFKTIDEAIAAHDAGRLTDEHFADLLKAMNVKTVPELKPAMKKMFDRMTQTEKATVEAVQKVDPELATKIENVTPTEEILNKLPDNAETVPTPQVPRQELDGYQRASVDQALQKINQKQFVEPRNKKIFPYMTDEGVPKTDPRLDYGRAVHHRSVNEMAQYNGATSILSDVSKEFTAYLKDFRSKNKLRPKGQKAPEPSRSEWMRQRALPMLREMEDRLRHLNLPVVIGEGRAGVPLGLSDILDALPVDLVTKYFFTTTKGIDPSQIMRIAEILVQHGTGVADEATTVKRIIENLTGPRTSGGQVLKDFKTGANQYSGFAKEAAKEGNEVLTDDVAKGFMDSVPKVMEIANHRAAQLNLEVGKFAEPVSESVIKQAMKVLADPFASDGAKVAAIVDAPKAVEPAAKKALAAEGKVVAPGNSVKVAEHLVGDKVNSLDGATEATQVADVSRGVAKAAEKGDTKALFKANENAMADAHKVADEVLQDSAQHLVYDIGAMIDVALQYRWARYLFGHIGNPQLRGMLINRANFAAASSKHIATQLGRISTTHAAKDIKDAFHALQLDQVPSEPKLLSAYNDLRKVIGDVYGHDNPEMSMFNRMGVKGTDIDKYADKYGLPESVRFGVDDPTTVSNSWRRWDVEDPLETLNRVHAASKAAGVLRSLGADISERWGSHVAGKGMVKIKDTGGNTIIGQMINLDKHYPEHIAKEMHVLESSLQTLYNPLASDKIFKFYDAGLHHLKAGWTIYRPGHHMRNLVGDMFFNYMDGVISPKWYKNAVEVLNVGRGQYKDWDSTLALQSTGIVPDTGRAVTTNGKISLTAKQAHKLMYQTGALPDYKVIEDTAFGAPTQDLTNILRRMSPAKGRIHDFAATTSEVRDHYVRASHWLKAFEDVKVPKNIQKLSDERKLQWMAEEASSRVRKWHPDGSDLTNFEKQAMRRVIPFYSWMRKAIPLVIESMFTRPGKVLMYPKATYSAAQAMGVDLESYTNPFPLDQLFPSWLQDSTQGPLMEMGGRYYGIRPGIPTADIMDDYFNSPVRTLASNLTPLIKTPAEAVYRHDTKTGVPITDLSDWIDRQIPGVSNVASITGRSPSSLFTQPTKSEATAEKYGEGKGLVNPVSALNLMLGGGLMDMSKPNYIKQAQFDARDRARKAAQERVANAPMANNKWFGGG